MDTVASSWSTQQLTEFLADVAGIDDEAALLRRAVERATEAVEAEAGALVGTEGVIAAYGFPRDRVPHDALETIAFWGEPHTLHVPGVGTCTVLVVPCDEVAGGRLVIARSGDGFTSEERGLLRGIARVLALSLRSMRVLARERALRDRSDQQARQNAALLESLRERQGLLERLARLQRSISAGRPLQEVLDSIVTGAHELLGDEVVAIRLLDAGVADTITTVAHVGLDAHVAATIRRARIEHAGVGGRAIQEGRLVVSEDYQHEQGTVPAFVREGLRAAMAAPIRQRGVVVGSIVVASHVPGRRYSDSERDALVAFAEHAGLALTDAHTVEALQEAVQQAMHQALHDTLTGLPNRALFLDRLEHARLLAQRDGRLLSVLFLDVDNFKLVNDSLGHGYGDELLHMLAHRLIDALRAGDTVARLGGDEFAVLLEESSVDGGEEAAARIRQALTAPFVLGGREVFVTASVGVVSSHDIGSSADELLRDADVAMYRAKASGRARHVVFEPQMRHALQERSALAAELRQALAGDRLELHYQPVVDVASGSVVAVEGLARWPHPRRGFVPPDEFVAVAEETGLVVQLGTWVLREACRQGASWHAAGRPLAISVNVSAHQIQEPTFVETVAAALADSGLPPDALCLEVTESLLLGDLDGSVALLREVKRLGVRVALDDFGTGYSSLSYLSRLPIDLFKVDKAFVAGLGVSSNDETVVRAVLSLGRSLGLVTVAEGVETEQQIAALLSLGCTYAQGFIYARPLPAHQVLAAVADVRLGPPPVPAPREAEDRPAAWLPS